MELKVNPERKQEILERYAKSTAGEWVRNTYGWVETYRDGAGMEYIGGEDGLLPEDAEFIAASHQDVPDLMADLETLEDDNAKLAEALDMRTKMLDDLGKGELSGLTNQQVMDLDGYANSQRVRADHLEMRVNHLEAENNRLREKLCTASAALRSTTDPVCECGQPHSLHILHDDGIRRCYIMDREQKLTNACEGFKLLAIEEE